MTTGHTEVVKSASFDRWLGGLKDRTSVAQVLIRIDSLAAATPGDVRLGGRLEFHAAV